MPTEEQDIQTLMKHIEDLHRENRTLQTKVKVLQTASDRMLTIEEAAEVMQVSTDWLYRNQRYKRLPFTVVLSAREIRFSLQGLLEWLKEQRNGRQSMEERTDVSHRVQL